MRKRRAPAISHNHVSISSWPLRWPAHTFLDVNYWAISNEFIPSLFHFQYLNGCDAWKWLLVCQELWNACFAPVLNQMQIWDVQLLLWLLGKDILGYCTSESPSNDAKSRQDCVCWCHGALQKPQWNCTMHFLEQDFIKTSLQIFSLAYLETIDSIIFQNQEWRHHHFNWLSPSSHCFALVANCH